MSSVQRSAASLAGLASLSLFISCASHPISSERVRRGEQLADALEDDALELAPVTSRSIAGDLSLNDLIELARRNNATLMRAGYGAVLARAQRNEALARVTMPTLSLQGSYFARSNQPATIAGFGGMNFRVPTGQKTQTQVEANLRQPLFSLSDFVYRADSAILQAKSAKLQFRQTWLQVRRQVILSSLDLLDLQSQLAGIDALLKSLGEQRRRSQAMLQEGMAIRNDILKVEVAIANQEQAKVELQNAIASTRVLLATLVGVDPLSEFRVVWDVPLPEGSAPPSPEEVFETALKSRPDLMALEVQKESQRSAAQTEWAAYVPRLDLGVGYNYNDADNLLENDFFFYTLTASVDLLDLTRHARIQQAKARIGELTGQALELERQARVDIELACRAVSNELSRYRQATIAEDASRENLRVERARYKEGKATVNDLLEAEVSLIREEINRRSARYSYFQALVDLDALSGVDGGYFPD